MCLQSFFFSSRNVRFSNLNSRRRENLVIVYQPLSFRPENSLLELKRTCVLPLFPHAWYRQSFRYIYILYLPELLLECLLYAGDNNRLPLLRSWCEEELGKGGERQGCEQPENSNLQTHYINKTGMKTVLLF